MSAERRARELAERIYLDVICTYHDHVHPRRTEERVLTEMVKILLDVGLRPCDHPICLGLSYCSLAKDQFTQAVCAKCGCSIEGINLELKCPSCGWEL